MMGIPMASLRTIIRCLVLLLLTTATAAPAAATEIEADPINYSKTPGVNVISRLQERLDKGQSRLTYEPRHGYLRALLKALHVPESSQMLVFSKTSFQNRRICPRTPRALYFNEDVYVGFCQRGDVLELTAVDSRLGAVFYTLSQKQQARPQFARRGDSCLICHASSRNEGLPGPLVRSVYPDAAGYGIYSASSRVDHTTPLAERWGGWYVTGTSGKQHHLGNLIVTEGQRPEAADNAAGSNVTDLKGRVRTAPYLSPHSDIVALMVLEHQTAGHNLITRANFLTRRALFDEAVINKALGRPATERSESTSRRIQNAGEPLLKYLLMSGETRFTEPVRGVSSFAEEFARRGPRDGQGRSLYELDLKRRLFKYPCSFLIYAPAFDALPAEVKDWVRRRLGEVLSGKDRSADFAHLADADRKAVQEILRSTKPGLLP
jgi:hypothetical protein